MNKKTTTSNPKKSSATAEIGAKLVSKIPRRGPKRTVAGATSGRNNAIMGIGQLLVVVSIAYSTAVVFIGVDTAASKLVLLPQAAFGLIILVKAFSKLYK